MWQDEPFSRYNFKLTTVDDDKTKGKPMPTVMNATEQDPDITETSPEADSKQHKRLKLKFGNSSSKQLDGRPIPTRDAMMKDRKTTVADEQIKFGTMHKYRSTNDLHNGTAGQMVGSDATTPVRQNKAKNNKKLLFTIKEEIAKDEMNTTQRRSDKRLVEDTNLHQ